MVLCESLLIVGFLARLDGSEHALSKFYNVNVTGKIIVLNISSRPVYFQIKKNRQKIKAFSLKS